MRILFSLGLIGSAACAGGATDTDGTTLDDTTDATGDTGTTTPVEDPDPSGVWFGDCAWLVKSKAKSGTAFSLRLAFTEEAGDVAMFGMLRQFYVDYPKYYQDLPVTGMGTWDGADTVDLDVAVGNDDFSLFFEGVMDGDDMDGIISVPKYAPGKTKKDKDKLVAIVDLLDCAMMRD